jgi:hypothetical protein
VTLSEEKVDESLEVEVLRASLSDALRMTGLFAWAGVIVGEAEAVVQWRVGVEPEDDESWRVGIVEILFAEDLEGMGGDFVGVGEKALDELEAVRVRGVLLNAADGVANGLAEEAHDAEEQEQDSESRPVGLSANSPGAAPASDHPLQQTIGEK